MGIIENESKDLADLRKKEDSLKRDQLDGLDIYLSGVATLNFVFDRYMKTRTGLRKTTRSSYIYLYERYVKEGIGKRKIASIKNTDVILFYEYLLEARNLSISTVENVQTFLGPTFDMAIRDEIIRKNPTKGVVRDLKRNMDEVAGVRRALTVEQERAFLEYLKEPENARWRPLFVVMFGTGCRIGEIIGLRWCDVKHKDGIIDINHQVSYYKDRSGEDGGRCEFILSKPKTKAGERLIPMLDAVRKAFDEEKYFQKLSGRYCTAELSGMSGFIFCNRFGGLRNASCINRAIRRIVTDYNAREEIAARKMKREPVLLPVFSCHITRHTFCARLCEQESNLKVIQTIMGHADIRTTMDIYAEVMNSRLKESFEHLSKEYDVF